MKKLLLVMTVFLISFLCWEALSRFYSDLLFVLPPPSKIFYRLWEKSDRFLYHTQVTLKEMGGGFVIALMIAFPLAACMLFWNPLRLIFQPVFIVIQCVPMFALAPIMVVWFGWSYTAIVIPTALMIFFPLTINIYQGLRSTPQHLLDYFKINQATRWQTFFKLQLPSALPNIFTGFRISAGIAGIGAVAGEWAGAQEGLGMIMLESRRGADLETTFAALFCLTFLSLCLYAIMTWLEERVSNRQHFKFLKRLTLNKKIRWSTVRLVSGLSILLILLGSAGFFLYTRLNTQEKDEHRLALDWLPNPNHVPLYVGIHKGFFARQDINLVLQKLHDPSDGLPYLTTQRTDLALSYTPYTLKAVSHGAKIKVIGVLIKEPLNSILVRSCDDIQTPDDLNGKVIGYCVDGSETLNIQTLLKDSQIKPKEMRNVSFDLVTSLGAKHVDAVYGAYWNIESEHLHSLNIHTRHFKVTDLGMPHYYELVVLARKDSRESEPEFAQRFQTALQESIAYSQENPKEAYEIYLQANPDKGAKAIAWEKKAWDNTKDLLADNQKQEVAIWQAYYDWSLENKMLKNHVDIPGLFP